MKKISLLQSLLFTSLLTTTIAAKAQADVSFVSLNPAKNTLMAIGTIAPAITLNAKALTAFHSSFPGATNVAWSDNTDGLVYVVFNTLGKTNRAMFNKKGKMLYSISYYRQEMLSNSLIEKVLDNYPGKSIYGITETSCNHETIYQLVLEDKTSWTDVKISGNEIIEERVWRKTQP